MSFDWNLYTGEHKWLSERTIYLSRHGSFAYGTNRPTSDLDLRGIAVAPINHYLGISESFEQAVQNDDSVDLTIFELQKFMRLASESNPNALEILFTDPSDHLLVHPLGRLLLESREMFLSQRTGHTFSAYARAQLARINAHYRWMKNPPKAPPTRAEFGLPERTVIPADQLAAAQAAIKKQVDQWNWHELEHLDPATRQAVQSEFTRRLLEITQWSWDEVDAKVWLAGARAIGLDDNFIRLLDLERQYTGRLKEWQQYQNWKKNRNPARAALEEKYGYDTKHAMHLVRLTKVCRELLVEGVVRVRRPDAAELLEILGGAWSYEDLIQYSEQQDTELSELAKTSKLPRHPDRKKIDQLCCTIIEGMV